ncbi:MAG: twin-arginine translocation signal domain-containing protein, partial [Candidatus Rokubacteria bacterium]|nr:twin-arginine translocation signal domain-containing protein [Candidatus Rokubacteria bacterium]
MEASAPKDSDVSRREFLRLGAMTAAGLAFPGTALALTRLEPIGDPLKEYPYRGWEDL